MAACSTIEFRSLLEDVRVSNPFVSFFEASCERVDTDQKVPQGGWRITLCCRPLAAVPAAPSCASQHPPATPVQVAYFTSRNTYEDGRRPSFEVRPAALNFTVL